jgi:hypothetical protein
VKRRRTAERAAAAGANIAAALGRAPRRHTVSVRLYDARGHAHTLDPDGDPGRRIVDAAEAMLRAAEEPSEADS